MADLHVHEFGAEAGVPLLALHGVTGHGARFRRLAEEGLPGRRTLAVDLRGHGRSTWDPPWHAGQHVVDLLDVLDERGLDRVDVLGHSFGGLLSLHLAATAPQRVGRVVLLDPAVELPAPAMLVAAEETRRDEGWASFDEALEQRRALRPPHAADTAEEDVAEHLVRDADGRFRFRYCRSAVVVAWSEMARPAPVLDAWGGELLLVAALQEDYTTPALRRSLARDLGPRLREVPLDTGHMLYWDAFADTVACVAPFLAG
jgi:lipase